MQSVLNKFELLTRSVSLSYCMALHSKKKQNNSTSYKQGLDPKKGRPIATTLKNMVTCRTLKLPVNLNLVIRAARRPSFRNSADITVSCAPPDLQEMFIKEYKEGFCLCGMLSLPALARFSCTKGNVFSRNYPKICFWGNARRSLARQSNLQYRAWNTELGTAENQAGRAQNGGTYADSARRREKTNGHDQKMIECLDTCLPRIKPISLLSGLEMLLSPIARHRVLPWESRVWRLMWSGPPRGVQTCPNTPSVLWGILERFTQRDAEWYVEICPAHFALNILNLLLQLLLYQGDVPSNLNTSYMFLLFLANTICSIEPILNLCRSCSRTSKTRSESTVSCCKRNRDALWVLPCSACENKWKTC